jgi:hypothetical protein
LWYQPFPHEYAANGEIESLAVYAGHPAFKMSLEIDLSFCYIFLLLITDDILILKLESLVVVIDSFITLQCPVVISATIKFFAWDNWNCLN